MGTVGCWVVTDGSIDSEKLGERDISMEGIEVTGDAVGSSVDGILVGVVEG